MKVNKLILTLSLVILIAAGCNKTYTVKNKLPINSNDNINSELDIVKDDYENKYVFSAEKIQKIHENSLKKIKALCNENNLVFDENISEDKISITYKDSSKNKPGDIIDINYCTWFDENGEIETIDMNILMVKEEGMFKIEDTIFNEFSNIMIPYNKDYTDLNNKINESIEKNKSYYNIKYYGPMKKLINQNEEIKCDSFTNTSEIVDISTENTIKYSIKINKEDFVIGINIP